MMLRTPRFWYTKKPGLLSLLLTPVSEFYEIGRKFHTSRIETQSVDIPVICVGNLIAGGSGKTPVVQSLYRFIKGYNIAQNPVILTRGYGGDKLYDPVRIEQDDIPSTLIGDEAYMLSKTGPVIVFPDRYRAARYAREWGHDMIIMDDGFQNPGLAKDLSFIVVDGKKGFGNGKLIPAGPLRESVKDGLARADACIIIGEDTYGVQGEVSLSMPCLNATIDSDFTPVKNKKYIAFCGIAHPDKFRATLKKQKVPLADFITYPDHYTYAAADITKLVSRAEQNGLRLVTTEKDAARLLRFEEKLAPYLDVLDIHVHWSNKDNLFDLLRKAARVKES